MILISISFMWETKTQKVGATMLQEHSFFSCPFIYFGSHQTADAETDAEEWNFTDPWSVALDADLSIYQQSRIGLFINWYDVSE